MELGRGQFTLGPEVLVGIMRDWGVLGVFANHRWDVAGWGDESVNLTTIQPIFTFLPGGGWNVGTGPQITYDWIEEQWTMPLNLSVGKTTKIGSTTWKFSVSVDYYVEGPDAFGPKWMISFSAAPVVENCLEKIFKGG